MARSERCRAVGYRTGPGLAQISGQSVGMNYINENNNTNYPHVKNGTVQIVRTRVPSANAATAAAVPLPAPAAPAAPAPSAPSAPAPTPAPSAPAPSAPAPYSFLNRTIQTSRHFRTLSKLFPPPPLPLGPQPIQRRLVPKNVKEFHALFPTHTSAGMRQRRRTQRKRKQRHRKN